MTMCNNIALVECCCSSTLPGCPNRLVFIRLCIHVSRGGKVGVACVGNSQLGNDYRVA